MAEQIWDTNPDTDKTDLPNLRLRLIAAGCVVEKSSTHDHYPDIYTPDTPEARKVLERYEYRANVSTFTATDGTPWLDVPFAWMGA